MEIKDFSNGFDTLLSSYLSEGIFGEEASRATITLDEYEKSQFLTKSQEETVIALYTGKNPYGESFEQTEEMRRSLAKLVKESELTPIENNTGVLGIDSHSKFFTLPEDTWFITYESVSIDDGKCDEMNRMEVVPARQDEYHKLKKNPFRGPNSRRSLRFDLSDGIIEIVSKYNVTKYYLRYLRKPNPILLIDLSDGMSLNGETKAANCELHESLHQRILDRAVLLALQSRGYTKNENN